MPKRGKGSKKPVVQAAMESDSNDDDIDPADFYEDEIDEFHSNREKILLDKGQAYGEEEESDHEMEVMGMDLSDDDLLSDNEIQKYKKQLRRLKMNRKKTDMGSDLEEEAEEPEIKSFGKKRSHFYVPKQDVDDDDIDLSGSDDEEGAALLEEKESKALQLKMAQELDTSDFGLEIFKPVKTADADDGQQKISQDLSKLTKKEKLQLLKKESPEMLTLIEDFKTKMKEVRDTFLPLLGLVREGKIQGQAADYVNTKVKLNLNYCTNISFYMVLKARRISVQNHPVIKRLVQYRNLMKELEPIDEQVRDEVRDIVDGLQRGEHIDFSTSTESKSTFVRRKALKTARQAKEKQQEDLSSDSEEEIDVAKKPKKKVSEDRYETKDEKAALEYYKMMKKKGKDEEEDISGEDDSDEEDEGGNEEAADMEEGEEVEDTEEKRAVSYEIEKNKGIAPKRKKEQRNPRVKHRAKFRKAKIRRRGQIREARTEMGRYGGEISGIRAGIKRGIKMKV